MKFRNRDKNMIDKNMQCLPSLRELYPPVIKKIDLKNLKLPSNSDYFYWEKRNEILAAYQKARFFMGKAISIQLEDVKEEVSNYETFSREEKTELLYLIKSYYYEATLYFYNTIIDISWVFLISSIASRLDDDKKTMLIKSSILTNPNLAKKQIRKIEKLVKNPDTDKTYKQLKKILNNTLDIPKNNILFSVLEEVQDFWHAIKKSNIRENYNFLKHRGSLTYEEVNSKDIPSVNIYSQSKTELTKQLSHSCDLEKKKNLENELDNLFIFDCNKLFPYISKLFNNLQEGLDISPIAE